MTDRDIERHRDRETGRQGDREAERQRSRDTETERQRDRDRETGRQRDGGDREACDSQTETQKHQVHRFHRVNRVQKFHTEPQIIQLSFDSLIFLTSPGGLRAMTSLAPCDGEHMCTYVDKPLQLDVPCSLLSPTP